MATQLPRSQNEQHFVPGHSHVCAKDLAPVDSKTETAEPSTGGVFGPRTLEPTGELGPHAGPSWSERFAELQTPHLEDARRAVTGVNEASSGSGVTCRLGCTENSLPESTLGGSALLVVYVTLSCAILQTCFAFALTDANMELNQERNGKFHHPELCHWVPAVGTH
ncbi:hypothetical protein E5288_WYG015662 [Bos mutus]|uniref:Uncharacterized protein n=1 Tax=Bos mutus TaxID=72004 RepID=A0A6B0RZI4_9CETA|nr:hypothetical protein [Bos mutus]